MTNTNISNAKNLSDIIVAMTHTILAPKPIKSTTTEERTEQRQKENTFLVNEIANSLMV
jgi:hypothetical protein